MLNDRAGLGPDEEPAIRKTAADLGFRDCPDEGALAVGIEAHRPRSGTVVAVHGYMAGQQKTRRASGQDVDFQRQLVAPGARLHADFQQPAGMAIDPAAAFGGHFEGGRYV